MTQRKQSLRERAELSRGLSRRALGAGVAALTLSSAKVFAAGESPVITPRAPGSKPYPFAFKINGPAERVGMSTERLKRIHDFLQRKMDANVIAGAVTAVARRGELVHYEAHGYANMQTKAPMKLDSMFRMASSTKPVTAVALLMMLEEGKVHLADPISKFIPEFKDMKVAVLKPGQPATRAAGAPPRQVELVPASRPITIVDLATHTSGLMSSGLGQEATGVQRGPDETLATYIPRLGKVALDFQPGNRWQYSGAAGLDTLGRIVEITSGKDLDTFVRERILQPLGMNDTYFNVPQEKKSRVLPAQRFADGKWETTPYDMNQPPTKYFAGSGGFISTCRDYMLFEQMLLNRGELNGKRLLGSRIVELMGTNQIGNLYQGPGPSGDQQGHGFGIAVRIVLNSALSDTGRSNGAFGWDGAFGTMSWNDKAEEIAAAIFIQQRDRDTMWGYERMVRQAIID